MNIGYYWYFKWCPFYPPVVFGHLIKPLSSVIPGGHLPVIMVFITPINGLF